MPSNKTRIQRSCTRGAVAGFTLMELIVVMAVIGILASIAVPSYAEYSRKGRRADAQQFIQEIAARQQHYLVSQRRYAVSLTASAGAGGLAMTIPPNVSSFYTINDTMGVNNAALPPAFAITATPKNGQSSERCGALTLTSSGVRSASGGSNCW